MSNFVWIELNVVSLTVTFVFKGTGKSYLLKKIVASFPPNGTYVTASTGVAACQIGGITLHAFAGNWSSNPGKERGCKKFRPGMPLSRPLNFPFVGIGSGKAPLHQCLELAQRPGVRQQWLNCRCLIIDEISMVEGEFFDKLEAVARYVEPPFLNVFLYLHCF